MTALSALHTVRTRIGLDDDCFRDLCEQLTGKRSTRAMNDNERYAVRDRMLADYPAAARPPKSKKHLSGSYAKKLQALWISGWNLGLVKNRNDEALIAFVKRQTGIQSMTWLRDPEDADKAVEALKKWLERAGVDWTVDKLTPAHARAPGFKIAIAQSFLLNPERPSDALVGIMHELFPNPAIVKMRPADWIKVMNALGEEIRVKAKLAKAG